MGGVGRLGENEREAQSRKKRGRSEEDSGGCGLFNIHEHRNKHTNKSLL